MCEFTRLLYRRLCAFSFSFKRRTQPETLPRWPIGEGVLIWVDRLVVVIDASRQFLIGELQPIPNFIFGVGLRYPDWLSHVLSSSDLGSQMHAKYETYGLIGLIVRCVFCPR